MSKADFKYTIYFISANGKACEARSRVNLRTRPQLALWLNDPTKRSYFTTLEKARCSNYYIPSEGEVYWTIEERDGTLRVQKNKIKFVYSLAKLSKYCTHFYELVCEVNDNPEDLVHRYINIDGTHPFFDNKEIFYNKAYAQDERYRRIREAQMDSITRRLCVHRRDPITKEYLNALYGWSELYYIPGWKTRSGFFDGEPKNVCCWVFNRIMKRCYWPYYCAAPIVCKKYIVSQSKSSWTTIARHWQKLEFLKHGTKQ